MGKQARAGSPKDLAEVELELGLPDPRGGCGPSTQLAPWGVFREDCGPVCLKTGLLSLFTKSFVQRNILAQKLDQDVEPAHYFALLRLTCGGPWSVVELQGEEPLEDEPRGELQVTAPSLKRL